jgi:hypothetical protein
MQGLSGTDLCNLSLAAPEWECWRRGATDDMSVGRNGQDNALRTR